MNIKSDYLGWFLILLFLLPTLSFPFSDDIVAFSSGADTLLNGGKIYADYVDIKPPLIYYLIAFAKIICGRQEYSLRIFDIIWQLSTIIVSIAILRKITGNRAQGILFGVLYSIAYTTLQFSNTLECETFVGLPLAIIIYIQLFASNKKLSVFLQGMLVGFITSLKFPLGLILAAVILDYFLNRQSKVKEQLMFILVELGGFLLFMALNLLPFTFDKVWPSYQYVIEYVGLYASHYSSIGIGNIHDLLKDVGNFFGYLYSLTFSIFTFMGLSYVFRKKTIGQALHLYSFLVLLLISLFLSMVVELKFLEYHFARLYLPLLIFTSTGLYHFLSSVASQEKKTKYYQFVLYSLIISGILFSPMIRWTNSVRMTVYALNDDYKYNLLFNEGDGKTSLRLECMQTAFEVNKNLKACDTAILIANRGSVIPQYLKTKYQTKFAHSCFYFNVLNPKKWKQEFSDELHNAKWVIVQKNDAFYFFNHHDLSSIQSLMADNGLRDFITKNFVKYYETTMFLTLRRI